MLLEARKLVKAYNGRTVVDHVTYRVDEREIVGLLGANGAGKTTSFRMTVGMIAADEGQVIFDHADISGLPMYQRARRGMGYLSQEPSVFQRLTVEDNLLAICETLRLTRKERERKVAELLDQFGLTIVRKNLAKTSRAANGAAGNRPRPHHPAAPDTAG